MPPPTSMGTGPMGGMSGGPPMQDSYKDQNTMAEEKNENDFYNAVQSLSSITDEKTRTLLAEILVKKEMKKKSGNGGELRLISGGMSQGNMGMGSQGMGSQGMSSQGMGSSGAMPPPTSMGAGPMGGSFGGPPMQDSYQDQNTMAEEANKNDFYNAVQSLSSITDEKTRTLLAEMLVKKEMKKKSGATVVCP